MDSKISPVFYNMFFLTIISAVFTATADFDVFKCVLLYILLGL